MIRAILTDLGGVILTNGWDSAGRARAIERFGLDHDEFFQRHDMVFGAYEEGRMTLDEYLGFAVFYCPRAFSRAEFVGFLREQSQPLPEMFARMSELKLATGLPFIAVSNEGREIAEYRIETFKLKTLIDAFIVSGFVGLRKPALEFYKLATDVAQVRPEEALYIDDRAYLVEAGERAGLMTLWHRDMATTEAELARHGLGKEQRRA